MISFRQTNIIEARSSTVRKSISASEPESALSQNSTAVVVFRVNVVVIVTVERGEPVTAVVCQHIARIARELVYCQQISSLLAANDERIILDPEPVSRLLLLQIHSQFVAAVLGQIMQLFVAEPEVATTAAKPSFVMCP